MKDPKPRVSWIGRHDVIRPRLASWARSSGTSSTPPQRSLPPRISSVAPHGRSVRPPQTSSPPGASGRSTPPRQSTPPDAELLSARIAIAALESALATSHAEADALRAERDEAIQRMQGVAAETEEATIAIATAIARRVVGRELTIEPSLIVDWVREALAETKSEATQIALAPDVALAVPQSEWDELASRIAIDPHLSKGAVEIRAGAHALGASADVRLENVAEAIARSNKP